MKAVLGNNVDVRALTETMLIEVKDIDETTDKTDILCAFNHSSMWNKGAPSQRLQSKGLLYAMQTQKGERLRSPNNEWEMPVLQEGYARVRQSVIEKNVDMTLISQQYRNKNSGEWVTNNSNKSAIWSCGNSRRQISKKKC